MSKEVYIVTEKYEYDDSNIIKGVFSTFEKAQEYMKSNKLQNHYTYHCDNYIVDYALKKKDSRRLVMTGAELSSRFIGNLEEAGFNPYLFSDGLMSDSDREWLTKEQCLALGMSEAEFNARAQGN